MQPQQLIPVLSLRSLTAVTSAAALQRPLDRPAAATVQHRHISDSSEQENETDSETHRLVAKSPRSQTPRPDKGVNQKEKMTIRFLSGAAIRASFCYCRSWPGTR